MGNEYGESNEAVGDNPLAVSQAARFNESSARWNNEAAPAQTIATEDELTAKILATIRQRLETTRATNVSADTEIFLAHPVVKYKDICRHHPEYDADRIKTFKTFYEQNSDFTEEFIKSLLPELPHEKGDSQRYNARIKRAYKVTPEKPLIEFFVASSFAGQDPEIACDKNGDEWEALNDHCGNGHATLLSVGFDTLRDVYLYHAGYNVLEFENETVKAPSDFGVTIKHLPAPCVDNWGCDDAGRYTWFRTYSCESAADPLNPFAAPLGILHRWSVHTSDCCVVYEALETKEEKEPDAQIVKISWHDFGRPPIFAVDCSRSAWLFRTIWDTLMAIWARSTATTCAIDDASYQILTAALFDSPPTPAGSAQPPIVVKDNASGAVILRTDKQTGKSEEMKFISPNPEETGLNFKDLERLNDALKMQLMATQLEAITKTQNARATATGKLLDAEPTSVISYIFMLSYIATVEEMISALADFRGQGETPEVQGIGALVRVADLMTKVTETATESGDDAGAGAQPEAKPVEKIPASASKA